MNKIDGWNYASVVALSFAVILTGTSLRHSRSEVKELQQRVTALNENLDGRIVEVNKQFASIQELLKLHNDLSAQQAEADEAFLQFMKTTNARLARINP